MKTLFPIVIFILCCCSAQSKILTYEGSTPAALTVRNFLGISLTDSIDFIKWTLTIHDNRYELNCRYGLSQANTNGFTNEKQASVQGALVKQGNYYSLQSGNKALNIIEINSSVLHLLDDNRQMLIGNGGYSFALNNKTHEKVAGFNYTSKETKLPHLMVYQGRTPCAEISIVMGIAARPECIKKKWYVALFTDATGKPSYYLQGGMQHKKETMDKGQWDIISKNGRIIYKLTGSKFPNTVYLLKADDNILFFTDAEGNLLVGNEDFSYTLNRTMDSDPK